VTASIIGAGLGLRRGLFPALAEAPPGAIDFFEVAPENWIRTGGRLGRRFQWFAERYPLVCHGLSLSLGGPAPLDIPFLRDIKTFLARFGVRAYTEHLSACGDEGQLYDLMPIPFTEEAVEYVAARIRRVQDVLERRIGIEHVSYYAAPSRAMTELEFVRAVLERADCGLLLDVNNLYVNGINFGYDPVAFLEGLPGERIMYVHIAGHHVEAPDLRIDTHASDVIEPVWDLLARAYTRFGVMPTLLERDFNYPPLPRLLAEVERIRAAQHDAKPNVTRR
jgi:uncharacterized protein (UPF0276 family)